MVRDGPYLRLDGEYNNIKFINCRWATDIENRLRYNRDNDGPANNGSSAD